MSVGAFAMNVDFLNLGESVTRLRGMPVEQMWSHLITGALMSRGRGGWAHDPRIKLWVQELPNLMICTH